VGARAGILPNSNKSPRTDVKDTREDTELPETIKNTGQSIEPSSGDEGVIASKNVDEADETPQHTQKEEGWRNMKRGNNKEDRIKRNWEKCVCWSKKWGRRSGEAPIKLNSIAYD